MKIFLESRHCENHSSCHTQSVNVAFRKTLFISTARNDNDIFHQKFEGRKYLWSAMFCSWRMTFEWLTLRWCELSNSKSLLLNIFLLSAGQICALNDTKTYYICQLDSFYSLILHFSCFLVLIQLGIQGEVISRSVVPELPHYRLETGGGNNCLILSLCQSALKWSSCHVGVTGVAETILTYRLATSFQKVVISSR